MNASGLLNKGDILGRFGTYHYFCIEGNDDAMRVKVRLNQYWHSDSSERIQISNIGIGAWRNA